MQQKVYQGYLESIGEALQSGNKRGFSKGFSVNSFDGTSPKLQTSILNESRDISLFNSLEPISGIIGKKVKYDEAPGAHPNFKHLKNANSTEYHYITSMFIDIKNSTSLFRNYDPSTVAYITNIIQRAAVHTSWYFDGYVQRYHGDGLFVYFGGKKMSLKDSVSNAINSASFFSHFMKHDLNRLFSQRGVEDIYTRIGIDTGYNEDVLWYLAGIKDCSEITTCSLHTSLAAKMQSNAENNGIMLGDHVKDNTILPRELFTIKKKEGKEERYIFQIPDENFNYTQWQFNWTQYLKNHPGVTVDNEGNLYFTSQQHNEPKKNLNVEFLKSQTNGYRPYYKR